MTIYLPRQASRFTIELVVRLDSSILSRALKGLVKSCCQGEPAIEEFFRQILRQRRVLQAGCGVGDGNRRKGRIQETGPRMPVAGTDQVVAGQVGIQSALF